MPDLSTIPDVFYQPDDPYNWVYDNKPLKNLADRLMLVNTEVDNNSNVLRQAVGSQGTLANRLAQSMEDDGSLRTSALDEATHSIAAHTDGSGTVSAGQLTALNALGYSVTNPVGFVRMMLAERNKLALISDDATALKLQVITEDGTFNFADQTVIVENSTTLEWQVTAPNRLKAHVSIPLESAHSHHYDLAPVHDNLGTPNYTNYKVTSLATPFITGSLRVYVNGTRLGKGASVYVPPAIGPDGVWTLTQFTEDAANGRFVLNRALAPADVIRIEFDTNFGA
jgi:hypothetical protein